MLSAGCGRDRGPATTANYGADSRTRTSAGDATDEGARARADTRSRERPFAFTAALCFRNGRGYMVVSAVEGN